MAKYEDGPDLHCLKALVVHLGLISVAAASESMPLDRWPYFLLVTPLF